MLLVDGLDGGLVDGLVDIFMLTWGGFKVQYR